MFISAFMPLPQAKLQLPQQYARSNSAKLSYASPHLGKSAAKALLRSRIAAAQ
jgi:hypothetical protein